MSLRATSLRAVSLAPAVPAHAPALALVHAAAFPPGERWDAGALSALLGLPGAYALAAAPDDGLAGFVLARVAADEAEVLTLAVLPGARGRGLGGLLLRAALDRAGEAGAAAMFLEVSPGNAPALALYARAGFAPAGRRRAYYPDGGDALVLRRPISPGAAGAGASRPPPR